MKKISETNLFVLLSTLVYFGVYLSGCAIQYPKNTENHKDNIVIIGTGGTRGIYYPTGTTMCRIINKKKNIHNLHCGNESTGGAVFNMNAVMDGKFDFGIARSEIPYDMYNGLAKWRGQPKNELRAVFNIYPDTVNLVTAADTGINTIEDLKGKKIKLGHFHSPESKAAIYSLTTVGINYEKDIEITNINTAGAVNLFCDGILDAFFLTTGHPSGYIKRATSCNREVSLIPMTNINGLIRKYPYFTKLKIPIKYYPKTTNRKDVETFALWSTLVTSINVPDNVVYSFTKEIFENLSALKETHPAYDSVTKESMLKVLSIPIHPGALRYYKEVGLK